MTGIIHSSKTADGIICHPRSQRLMTAFSSANDEALGKYNAIMCCEAPDGLVAAPKCQRLFLCLAAKLARAGRAGWPRVAVGRAGRRVVRRIDSISL